MWTVYVFKDRAGKWRWNLKAPNGRKFATSGESFARKYNAVRAGKQARDLVVNPNECVVRVSAVVS